MEAQLLANGQPGGRGATVPLPVALPPLGTIGFLTTLTTAEGITCSDWKTVDTGASTLSAEAAEEEIGKLPKPRRVVPDKNKNHIQIPRLRIYDRVVLWPCQRFTKKHSGS